MEKLFWFVLCGGYWLLMWMTKRKKNVAKAALCFLDGFYLGLICFGILPLAMETPFFYGAVLFSGLGVLAGVFLEKRVGGSGSALLFTVLTLAYFGIGERIGREQAFLLAFFGGIGLYRACAGIVPDQVRISRALLSGGGFLMSVIAFAGIC